MSQCEGCVQNPAHVVLPSTNSITVSQTFPHCSNTSATRDYPQPLPRCTVKA